MRITITNIRVSLSPRTFKFYLCSIAVLLWLTSISACSGTNIPSKQQLNWQNEWSVKQGFDINVDSKGFDLPTSISFVPNPGDLEEDPLYFVSEIQGAIKVVTNNRSVSVFANDIFGPVSDFKGNPLGGVNGICLAPENGFLFATVIMPDDNGTLRNSIVRYSSDPYTFSITAHHRKEIGSFLKYSPASLQHPIGSCVVHENLLYVAVGDASQFEKSQQRDSLAGKILRMQLDGSPVPDNPFYRDSNPSNPLNYVWASGLRNPFGLEFINDTLFSADNGPAIDRFLKIEKGGNYLWDGNNLSIGTNADAIIYPSDGVAQISSYPKGSNLFPSSFADGMFITISADPGQVYKHAPGVLTLSYDFKNGKVKGVPTTLVKHRGTGKQVLAGMAFGPDGLYIAPMLPDPTGESSILRIHYQPDSNYPYRLDREPRALSLMNQYGCFQCHSFEDIQNDSRGPTLTRSELIPRLSARIHTAEYSDQLSYIDTLNEEPYINFASARKEVDESEGLDKLKLWVQYRIQEPRFDNTTSVMPNLGITNSESSTIAEFLIRPYTTDPLEGSNISTLWTSAKNWITTPTSKNAIWYVTFVFFTGLITGAITVPLTRKIIRRLNTSPNNQI